MKRDDSLINERLSDLQSYTYYRQRFDACPHYMFFVGDAHGSDTHSSRYPFGQRITCASFSQNKADWHHVYPELEYSASRIVEAAKENPDIAQSMIDEFKPWEYRFYEKCIEIKNIDLSNLSDPELLKLYKELAGIYVKKLNPSPLIDGFALSTDTVIAQKLEEFLSEKGLLKDFVKFFEILTAPTFLSFLQEEELSLLRKAKQIEDGPDQSGELIKAHQRDYFWIQNNYVRDNVLTEEFFQKRINSYSDIDNRIQGIENTPIQNKQRKEELIDSIELPKEIVVLLEITDRFNYWQDERKKGTFWATHYFSLLLSEIARRTDYTLDELKYSMPPEIDEIMAQKIPREELQKRYGGCFIVWVPGKYGITCDKELIRSIHKLHQHGETSEIKGMPVSLGIATGKVKILESVEEIEKIEEGDILVAVMTRPDYVPAMAKAAAFVTDEGGLTCHAAIVAREMKKPCIVGTRIATKVLEDGDLVEVDADKGTVTILEKSEST